MIIRKRKQNIIFAYATSTPIWLYLISPSQPDTPFVMLYTVFAYFHFNTSICLRVSMITIDVCRVIFWISKVDLCLICRLSFVKYYTSIVCAIDLDIAGTSTRLKDILNMTLISMTGRVKPKLQDQKIFFTYFEISALQVMYLITASNKMVRDMI